MDRKRAREQELEDDRHQLIVDHGWDLHVLAEADRNGPVALDDGGGIDHDRLTQEAPAVMDGYPRRELGGGQAVLSVRLAGGCGLQLAQHCIHRVGKVETQT